MLPTLSLKSSLASLKPEIREQFLASLDTSEQALLAFVWPAWAHPSQLPPPGSWRYWLFLAGRGAGKTRAGAEWVRQPRGRRRRHAHRAGGAHGCRRARRHGAWRERHRGGVAAVEPAAL